MLSLLLNVFVRLFKVWCYIIGTLGLVLISYIYIPIVRDSIDKVIPPAEQISSKYDNVLIVYNNLLLHLGQQEAPPLHIVKSDQINAWTDGTTVAITTGLIDATHNDDEIAMILAHELSHFVMLHATNMVVEPVNAEAQADKMGAFIMLRSGYDVCKGRETFKILQKIEADCALCTTHPGDAYRYHELSMPWCSK